jgi:hypothetical protein
LVSVLVLEVPELPLASVLVLLLEVPELPLVSVLASV